MTPETIIASAIGALNDLETGLPDLEVRVGQVELDTHRPIPSITWVDAESELRPVRQPGGNPQRLLEDYARYRVVIWSDSRANARALLNNLVIACRLVGLDSQWGAYRWEPTKRSHAGVALVADVTIWTTLTDEVVPTESVDEVTASVVEIQPDGSEIVIHESLPITE